ncbi:hypothetical protein [Microbulbifer celer]|uniref:Uncharacterized protein n=1 Tax=Microbulbifer celer TaxID=435905 RepID=A0ABW3U6F6_9GAMM|nr:hypothetical protein [Microbulbifer celer]UFN58284.1 hypothetical protein LPW13_04370 [Microbulbifer celer]
MQIYKRKLLYFLISIVVLSLIAIYFHISWRLSQVDAGICPAEGRVLSDDELRKAMLRSLVLTDVKAANKRLRETDRGWQVGIGPDITTEELKRIAKESLNNEKSFEGNFSIEIVAPEKDSFDVSLVPEKFTLFTYFDYKDELAAIFFSESAEKIKESNWLLKSFDIGFLDRYSGFGNHYYGLYRVFISKDCCDNRTYYRESEVYRKDSVDAYLWTLKNIDKQKMRGKDIIAVSNCGDVLTRKGERGMGPRLNITKWIRWGYSNN